MLDIKYFKQIDEVLEVQGFKIDLFDGIKYFMFEFPNGERWSIVYNETFDYVNNWKDVYYPLYLQRVIEAINKKNFNEGSYSFSYQILTEIDNYHVYDKYKEKTLERFYFGKRHDYDTKKEKAIIYIMDHIKEKV